VEGLQKSHGQIYPSCKGHWSKGFEGVDYEEAYPSTPIVLDMPVKEEKRYSMSCLIEGGNRRQESMEPLGSTWKRDSIHSDTPSCTRAFADYKSVVKISALASLDDVVSYLPVTKGLLVGIS
jgi:hypothetical protein